MFFKENDSSWWRVAGILIVFAVLLGCGHSLHAQGFGEEPAWEYEGDLEERAAENAIELALRESTELRVDPGLIASIEADLELIYAYDPGLAAAPVWLDFGAGRVLVTVSDRVDQLLENDEYEPWHDLQGEFGEGEVRRISGRPQLWVLSLDESLNSIALADRVEDEWPGIERASPDWRIGDGSDVQRSAELRWYAFILRWGDCPSGCTGEKRRLVAIENGEVVELDRDDAKERLEVSEVSYPEEIAASVGDTLHLRGEATLAPVADPSVEIEAELRWAVERDGSWDRVRRQYHVSDAAALDSEIRVEVVHPLSGAYWSFAQELIAIDRAGISGDRYADYWLSLPVGWVNDRHYPWLWTIDHEWWWLHEEASSESGWWVYDFELDWIYVSLEESGGYPHIFADGRWLLYLEGTRMPRHFYDYGAEDWISVEQE